MVSTTRRGVLKIEKNEELKVIKVGDRVITKPVFISSPAQMCLYLGLCVDVFGIKGKYRCPEERLFDHLGMPWNEWADVFNKCMIEMWVDPVRDFSYLFYGDGCELPSPEPLERVHKLRDLLVQAKEDGLDNIIPLIFYSGKTPSEFKKTLGKGLCKQLCKNDRERNLLISKAADYGGHRKYSIALCEETIPKIRYANSIPTEVLKEISGRLYMSKALVLATNNIGTSPINVGCIAHLGLMANDTYMMSKELGEKFSFNWSLKRMEKQHNLYTKKIAAQQNSKDPFEYTPISVEYEGYTARLLMSPYEVGVEGCEMDHCVAVYAKDCCKGSYAVFSIECEGKRYSTLGLIYDKKWVSKTPKWWIHQHYKASNKEVDSSIAHKLAELCELEMNKVNGDKGNLKGD